MSHGPSPVEWTPTVPRSNHAFQYLVGRAIGEMIVRDHSLIKDALESLERCAGGEPQRAHIHAIWGELLLREPADIVAELGRDDARGDLVRQTRPPFVALPAKQRAELVAQARRLTSAG